MAIEIKDGFEEDEDEVVKQEEASADEEIAEDDFEFAAKTESEEPTETEAESEDEESVEDESDGEPAEKQTEPEAGEESEEPSDEAEPKTETGAESNEVSGEAPEAEEKAEKKSLFGKKKEKRDKKDDKIDELTDLLKRNMAEFDNFRKRTEKEKSAMYEIGARSVIEKLLPIVDNFERGLATKTDEDKENDSFANGMDLVYKQILKLFEDLGVEVIETEGKTFDPSFHNAVMHIDDENLGENVIAQEFQKGYTYRGTVIRHSMVQVAN